MDLPEARERFDRAIQHCDDIVKVHSQHGGGRRGFRTLEPSLNRAVVVMAVAAWQTAVQDLTEAALDYWQPEATATGLARLLRGQVRKAIGDLNTPSCQNSRSMMQLLDFDPRPYWTWTKAGGKGVGRVVVRAIDAENATRDWLSLRHDIARGHAGRHEDGSQLWLKRHWHLTANH